MSKLSTYILFISASLFFVSCTNSNSTFTLTPTPTIGRIEQVSPTSTPTPLTSAIKLAPTNTKTPSPTKQPSPTKTSAPTSTRTPSLQWSDSFDMSHLKAIDGLWAGTEDKFLLLSFPEGSSGGDGGILSVATAPEFNAIPLSPEIQNGAYNHGYVWSLNSQSIVYACLPEEYYPTLCIMDVDGENSRVIDHEIRAMNYIWPNEWVDQDTLIFSQYTGGGHVDLLSVNVTSGKKDSWLAGINSYVGPSNGIYAPAIGRNNQLIANVVVVSKTFFHKDFSMMEGSFIYGNVRLLPNFQSISWQRTSSKFEGWLPNSNQLLISWTYIDPSIHNFQNNDPQLEHNLLLWDLENNKLLQIAPNGRGGKFSPDGNLLIYLTSGPAKLDQDSKPVPEKPTSSEPESDYMQLLDRRSGKVNLSVPIVADIDFNLPEWETFGHGNLSAQFSPDSRFLSFLTPGEVMENPSGWPAGIENNDASIVMLNLLDLKERKIIWSIASNREAKLSWSPTSKFMTYQDKDLNWQLFDIHDFKSIPITLNNGNQVYKPTWSYDGKYLSFQINFSEVTILKVMDHE